MPTIEDYFPKAPSKYLKTGDVIKEMVVTIKAVEPVEFKNDDGSDERKPVISFEEDTKSLVCNKTNFKTIAMLLGDDTNDWIGEKVAIFPGKVEFKGRLVDSIRVRLPKKQAKPAVAADADLNDEVPF